MTMKRLRHALLTITGAVALLAGLVACHYLGVSRATAVHHEALRP
jgi:hypothetical protein